MPDQAAKETASDGLTINRRGCKK